MTSKMIIQPTRCKQFNSSESTKSTPSNPGKTNLSLIILNAQLVALIYSCEENFFFSLLVSPPKYKTSETSNSTQMLGRSTVYKKKGCWKNIAAFAFCSLRGIFISSLYICYIYRIHIEIESFSCK